MNYRKNRTDTEMKKLAAWKYLTREGETPKDAARELAGVDFDDDSPEFGGNGGCSFVVARESDALQIATDYIKNSLWAFHSNFLAGFCGLPREVFEAIQANDKCEGNNATIEILVRRSPDGLASFVKNAIRVDGIGHFLSAYDGGSEKIQIGPETFIVWKR
jgi:hypothetical protein